MELGEGPLRAILSTKGRRTGRDHSVELRAVFYNGRIYFSRRNPDSDWLKNALADPCVTVKLDSSSIQGRAALVRDEELSRKISRLKYSDKRADDSRIVLEVTPCG